MATSANRRAKALSLLFLAVCLGLNCGRAEDKPLVLKSPDGRIVVSFQPGDHLTYSATFHGSPVLDASALGMIIKGVDLGQNAAFNGTEETQEINEKYANRGVHAGAVNHCLATVIPLVTGEVNWKLEVRVFNDGIAYRYLIPGDGTQHIDGESSSWNVPGESVLWYQDAKNRAYESRFASIVARQARQDLQLMAPATLKLPNNLGYCLMTEANVVDYSDMDLQARGNNTFRALFFDSPRGWDHGGPITTPWRVTVLTPDLNSLVNTDMIKNLCPPPAENVAGAAWIRPGRSVWHWLIAGHPKLEEQKTWIDGTSELGFDFYLIDDGWKDWNGGGEKAWAAMADLVKYAKSKNVDLWAWVVSDAVIDGKERKAYFQKAKDTGIVGLKIDFPKVPDAHGVNWYDDVLKDAAEARLMIVFHGAVKPSGRDRTLPQELSREAVAGREQGKNSAIHDTALPFVRYVQGHADYTPTLLQPSRLGGSSFAHELAMAIVFSSEFLCLGDSPRTYLDSNAADVIKALPSVWDETVVLPGSEIGQTAAYARRQGDQWFIGIINGPEHRGTIPLSFLGLGTYKLVELADSTGKEDVFIRSEKTVTSEDVLTFPMRKDGGYVAWLTKAGGP